MPWRLIVSIVIFAVFLVFITFNLDNRCDLSFGLVKFEQVPVFITIFFSFILGLICSFPLVLLFRRRRGGKSKREKIKEGEPQPGAKQDDSIANKRKKFMRGHAKSPSGGSSNETD